MTPLQMTNNIRYITNSNGKTTDVVIPVELWQELMQNIDTESGLKWIDENEPKEQILADLQTALQQAKAGETYPIEELWTDLES